MSEGGSGSGVGRSAELPVVPTEETTANEVSRRDALKVLGMAPIAAALGGTPAGVERAIRHMENAFAPNAERQAPDAPYKPRFFTTREFATVRLLADYVIPRDERSGSATDAKAPEFVDAMLADPETREGSRVAMRGGLAWLDLECRRRFQKTFAGSSDAERRQVLDDIAWPEKAKPEYRAGVAFFNRFRDAIASGFYSSAMGWKDLQYIGNVFNPNWHGCPPEATRKLGVSYEEYEKSLAAERAQRR